MQIENYLKEYQPVIYKTFVNALETKKLSHAYLLSGSIGMPLKETALYLAKIIEPLNITVTRIAYGLPMGGNLDYTDSLTISKAIEGRRKM